MNIKDSIKKTVLFIKNLSPSEEFTLQQNIGFYGMFESTAKPLKSTENLYNICKNLIAKVTHTDKDEDEGMIEFTSILDTKVVAQIYKNFESKYIFSISFSYNLFTPKIWVLNEQNQLVQIPNPYYNEFQPKLKELKKILQQELETFEVITDTIGLFTEKAEPSFNPKPPLLQ